MNRQERRRQERLGVSQQSIYQRYREDAYNQGWHDGMAHELEITFNILAYTLTYKTGYSTKRIKELLHDLYNNVDSFRSGHLTPEDYDTICKELEEKGLTLHEIMKTIN